MTKTAAFDVETIPSIMATNLLPKVKPRADWKDETKIAADLERRRAAQLSDMGKVINQNKVICFGWYADKIDNGFLLSKKGESESDLLPKIWRVLSRFDKYYTFNGNSFDVPILNIHSIRHRIKPPISIDHRRYFPGNKIGNHLDLFAILSGGEIKKGNLDYWFEWFGLHNEVSDHIDGSQVASEYEKDNYDIIVRHCLADCEKTHTLGEHVEKYMRF